jgi:AcrR family transcriptional regulator
VPVVDRPQAVSREQIRAVAQQLFEERGYPETSLTQIADAAGISRDQLRSMFPTKADLIWDGIDNKYDRLVATLQEYRHTGLIADGVRAAFRSVLDHSPDEQELVAAGMETLDRNPMLYSQVEERLAAHKQAFIKFIADETGQAPDDYLPVLLGETVWITSIVTTRHWAATDSPRISLSEAVDRAVGPILDAYADRLAAAQKRAVEA